MLREAATDDRQSWDHHHLWSSTVLLRYWGMQLPATAIVLLVAMALAANLDWPQWVPWAAAAVWTAKDAILYLFVGPAYDPAYQPPFPYRMEGAKGVAVKSFRRTGTVRVWGELWLARSPNDDDQPIHKGQKVRVKAREGLTLIVEAAED